MHTNPDHVETGAETLSTAKPDAPKRKRRLRRKKSPGDLVLDELLVAPTSKMLGIGVFSALVAKRYPHLAPSSHVYLFRRFQERMEPNLHAALKKEKELATFRPHLTFLEEKLFETLETATGLSYTDLHTFLIHQFAIQLLSGSVNLPDGMYKAIVGESEPIGMAIHMLKGLDLRNDPRIEECRKTVGGKMTRRKLSRQAAPAKKKAVQQ